MEVFSKWLSETDVLARLSIPVHALPYFQNLEGQDVLVTDSTDQEWMFRFYTRNEGHPKPCFTAGWIAFSKAKGLKPDDLLIFSVLEDGRHKIEVVRETDRKLFGQPLIWIPVEQA